MAYITALLLLTQGVALIWYLSARSDEKLDPTPVAAALIFGGLVTLVVPIIRDPLLHLLRLPDVSPQHLSFGLLGGTLIAASLEEIAKFAPLAILFARKHYIHKISEGVTYFALAGVGFAFVENLGYAGILGGGHEVGISISRLLVTLCLHPGTVAIIGYYFARAQLGDGSNKKVIAALVAMSLAHTAYNLGATSSAMYVSLPISLVLTVGIGIFLGRAVQDDWEIGLSDKVKCLNCGTLNPADSRYCSHCAKPISPPSPQAEAAQPNTQVTTPDQLWRIGLDASDSDEPTLPKS